MRAEIGSKYIEMSTDGVYLSANSCFRLGERAIGKPIPHYALDTKLPKAPVLNGTDEQNAARMAIYEKTVARINGRVAKRNRHMDEFANVEFVWARVRILDAKAFDEDRIMAMVHRHTQPLLVDVVTGSLFSESSWHCLSSTQIKIITPPWPSTQAERIKYMQTRADKELGGEQKDTEE